MASSVFFKFKSSKEPTRVEFDGTGISVFELKREIIIRSGLGDGTDFDLVICADEAMKEVYDDDTTIIPRSTTVIARRMPPKIPGRGGAARYVSGKMPVHAKNSSRKEQIVKPLAKPTSNPMAQLSSAMTEEEKMAAVFQAQTENFTSREEEMATQQYVAKGGPKKPQNVPDHDPPQGYICYRCGEKGHWIQSCPTNDNPEYDNRPRVKRTTGIPKSFLKTVDKATALGQNADGDDSKTPAGIMVNADGEFVIAEPDKASWEQFQAKAKSNGTNKISTEGDKEVQERGLECPIDRKMFIDPMKTPCCEKTYCNDCITNALIETDFICPGCKSEGILIDDLIADEEAVEKMKAFLAEKDSKSKGSPKSPKSPTSATAPKSPVANGEASTVDGKQDRSNSKSPSSTAAATAAPSATSQTTSQTAAPSTDAATSSNSNNTAVTTTHGEQQVNSKKRPAEDPAENPKIPKAPKAMQQKAQQSVTQQQQDMFQQMMNGGMPGMPGMPGMGMMNPMMFPGMPPMPGMPGMGMGGMPNMPMNMNMGMMNPMMNPMMAGGMNGGFGAGMGPGGFGPGAGGMPGGMGPNGGVANGGGMWGGPNDMNGGGVGMPNGGGPNNMGMGMGMGMGMNGRMNNMNMNMNGGGGGGFQHHHNQQHHQQQQVPHRNFSHQPVDEDDAYFRKPVNPHRHQNRQRRVRPSDYREL